MRKLLYLSILLVTFSQVHAQENRGTLVPAKVFKRSFMVGGSLSGSYKRISINNNGETLSGYRHQYDLNTKVGYFVWSDVAFGLQGTLFHSKEKMSGQIGYGTTNILAGPFARYYLDNGFFGEGSAAMGINNKPNAPKTDIAEYRAGVGYAIFINPKVSIEPAILMSYYQETRPTEENRKLTEWGPVLNVGLQVYLYRERKFKLAPRSI